MTRYKHIHLFEMVTVGAQRWGESDYLVKVHGGIDDEEPHLHILRRDFDYSAFDFRVSLIDLVSKGELNLMYQCDKQNGVRHIRKSTCSWNSYQELLDGLKLFLCSPPLIQPNSSMYKDNLDLVIDKWNIETDYFKVIEENGNPFRDYLSKRVIKPQPEYEKYFSE